MSAPLTVVVGSGGVGKTTLAANLAAAFADLSFKTLLVEVDPQGSLVRSFGLDRFDLHHGLFGCMTGDGGAQDASERDVQPNLDLLPANVWSHEEELQYLHAAESSPLRLRALVREVRDAYDYVILDCPPSLGPLTRAALAAVDRYLIPVQAEASNLSSLSRLEHLAGEVRTSHNPELELEGYVVTMADLRTRHANDIVQQLSRDFPRDLLQTIVPRSIRVADEALKGRPTVAFAGSSRAGKALQDLAEEILSRHSRERAAHRAAETPDRQVAESDELQVWERVLAEMPDDDTPSVSSKGNGMGGWDRN